MAREKEIRQKLRDNASLDREDARYLLNESSIHMIGELAD